MADQQSTAPRPFCFVLMPFAAEFDDVYQIGIKEACAAAGAYCERVDEQIFHERILDRIYNQIAKADLIIADMTGRNPNVFYEVGYAHGLNRPTILITKTADDIPFDLKHFPHIVYGAKLTTLRDELTKRVAWCIANGQTGGPHRSSDVEVFLQGQSLLEGDHYISGGPHGTFSIDILLHNVSPGVLESDGLRIGVWTPCGSWAMHPDGAKTTELPDGGTLIMLPALPAVFPDSYEQITTNIQLKLRSGGQQDRQEVKCEIRVYSRRGVESYPFFVSSG